MSIDLGLPTLPPPTLAQRRLTRQIKVGKVLVGGDAPVSVQSMTTTLTADINATLQQIAAIDAGCAAVRVNPGNIRAFDDQVKEIARAAGDRGISIRIGVNAGSLDKRLLAKYGKATPEALVDSALWEASLFEEHGFRDIKISVKHNDPVVMVRAYELLAAQCD